jgi:hypothetical protein
MFLVPEFSPGPTNGAGGLFYFPGFQVAATSLVTFISPCGSVTVGTEALNIPIGKEPFTFRAITLVDYF